MKYLPTPLLLLLVAFSIMLGSAIFYWDGTKMVMGLELFIVPFVCFFIFLVALAAALFRRRLTAVIGLGLIFFGYIAANPFPAMYIRGVSYTIMKYRIEQSIRDWLFQQVISDESLRGSASQFPHPFRDHFKFNGPLFSDFCITKPSEDSRRLTIGLIGFCFGCIPTSKSYVKLGESSYVFWNPRE